MIKLDVMEVFHQFFRMGNTANFARINSAIVALLPNKDGACAMGDFRPMSLIHSMSKLISKVLSMRLSTIIEKIISPAQCAFLKKKCIHDSFLYMQNCVRSMHRNNKPGLLLKLDIARAFDSISWEYMFELMQRGFSSRWRDWIALILSSSSSMFLLNGTAGEAVVDR